MESELMHKAMQLYQSGHNLKQTALRVKMGREIVRSFMKKAGILRGRGAIYSKPEDLSEEDKTKFAELLDYLFGDGYISFCIDHTNKRYDCAIFFSVDEEDLVQRVTQIINSLFGFSPRILRERSLLKIAIRQSLAKHLCNCGFVCGKKSKINPSVQIWIIQGSHKVKISFVRGFLNAEASINRGVSVQQSVQIDLQKDELTELLRHTHAISFNNRNYHYLSWRIAKRIIPEIINHQSNMLSDLKEMLSELDIQSNIYGVIVHITSQLKSSIHYELYVYANSLNRLFELNAISCEKKIKRATETIHKNHIPYLQFAH